jgi:hypothetical protein
MNASAFAAGMALGMLLSPATAFDAFAVCGDWDWNIHPTRRVDSTWSGQVDDFSTDAEVSAAVGSMFTSWNDVAESPFSFLNGGNLNIGDTQDLTDVPDGQAWFTDAQASDPDIGFTQWRTENGEGACGVNLLSTIPT